MARFGRAPRAAGCGAGCYAGAVEADAFDEETFFRALAQREGEIRAWATQREEEALSAEEFAALLAIPITAEQVAEVAALVAWFERRYPSVRERFAYVRQARARWPRRAEPAAGGAAARAR